MTYQSDPREPGYDPDHPSHDPDRPAHDPDRSADEYADPAHRTTTDSYADSETGATAPPADQDTDEDERHVISTSSSRSFVEEDVTSHPQYGFGSVLALLGAVAMAVSVFLSWLQDEVRGNSSETFSATDIAVPFLWDTDTALSDDPSLLFVIAPAVVLVIIGAFIPRARWTAWLGGLVGLAVPVLYTISAGRVLSDRDSTLGAFDWIDVGTWVCAIGAALAIIGATMLPREKTTTHREVREVTY